MQTLATLNHGLVSATAPQLMKVRTHVGNSDEILHNAGPSSRFVLGQNSLGNPVCNFIRKLDDQGDIIIGVAFLVPGSLQTFDWPDLLVQLTLHQGQLPRHFQWVNVR